jgi:hypothetical protein
VGSSEAGVRVLYAPTPIPAATNAVMVLTIIGSSGRAICA